jgi:hypothetical protein
MKHENDCRELASKLVMMKNQIMENDVGKSIGRKFAAVRIGLMKQLQMTPVSVSTNSLNNTMTYSLNSFSKEVINTTSRSNHDRPNLKSILRLLNQSKRRRMLGYQ